MHGEISGANAFLVVDDLTFDAEKNRPILRGVSLSVGRGERVALVGSNGAGKTTTLRCVDRLLENWTGEIRLDGVSIRKIPRRELAKKIAFVRQISGSYSTFSARQVVEFGRFPYLKPLAPLSPNDEKIVDAALERTGASAFAARPLDELSGGERQKVLLAAAFAQEPELLLLDEPTTFLDYRSQNEISATISDWSRETGATVLEATHDLNRAALFADSVVALDGGRVVFSGPARETTTPNALRTIFGAALPTVAHPTLGVPMILPETPKSPQ